MSAFADLLLEHTQDFLSLTSNQLNVLENHWRMLVGWNRILNLTTVTRVDEVIRRHYVESLFLASALARFSRISEVADIGSGAGFPGIPVAVVRAEQVVVLVESHKRKAVFLRESTRELPNVRIEATRFEQLGQQWDTIVSRAVAWDDIEANLTGIRHVGLLVGPDTLTRISESSKVEWEEPLPVPHSIHSYVLLGTVRSTSRALG